VAGLAASRRLWAPFDLFFLNDRLRVIACDLPGAAELGLRVEVPGGSAAEPRAQAGLASLAALLRQGALARLASEAGLPGGSARAWCTHEYVAVDVRAARNELATAAGLADRGLGGAAPPSDAEIAEARRTRIAELALWSADPRTCAIRLLRRVWHGEGAGWDGLVEGEEDTVSGLGVADVHRAWHGARTVQADVFVAGDLYGLDLGGALERAFAGWDDDGSEPEAAAPTAGGGEPGRLLLREAGGPVAAVSLGRLLPALGPGEHLAALWLGHVVEAELRRRLGDVPVRARFRVGPGTAWFQVDLSAPHGLEGPALAGGLEALRSVAAGEWPAAHLAAAARDALRRAAPPAWEGGAAVERVAYVWRHRLDAAGRAAADGDGDVLASAAALAERALDPAAMSAAVAGSVDAVRHWAASGGWDGSRVEVVPEAAAGSRHADAQDASDGPRPLGDEVLGCR
jgi:hypothetical protein